MKGYECTHDLIQAGEYVFTCKVCERFFGINSLLILRGQNEVQIATLQKELEAKEAEIEATGYCGECDKVAAFPKDDGWGHGCLDEDCDRCESYIVRATKK